MASSRLSKEVVCLRLHLPRRTESKNWPFSKRELLMKIRRIISFAILLGVLLLPLIAQAQSPSPTPAPVRSLSDNIAALSQRAGSLLPYINNEIVSKLI